MTTTHPALTVTLQVPSDLNATEHAAIAAIDARSFINHPYAHHAWSESAALLIGRVDGVIAGHVALFVRDGLHAGKPARIGGVGGVMTDPDYRGRGLARLMMQRAATWMLDEQHADFGLIVCTPEVYAFYAQLGWRLVNGPMICAQPGGSYTWPDPVMVLPRTPDWQDAPIDLCGLPW